MLYVQPSPRSHPVSLLKIVYQQLGIESLPFLTLETYSSDNNQVILIDFDSMKARR